MSGVVQIRVAGTPVGIIGLSEIFEEAVQRAVKPDEEGALTLLELVERVNYVPQPARADYAASLLREFRRFLGEDVPPEPPTGLQVKVLGPGCPQCERLERMVREVLARDELAGEVEHIRDLEAIASYGLIPTPGLVINGKVMCAGKVPPEKQLRQWLREGLNP